MMGDARTALLLAAAALGLVGCVGPADARALDRICKGRFDGDLACEIVGSGALRPGPTYDSIGFSLLDATLVIHLDAVAELRTPGRFDVELLTASKVPETQLDTQITWGSCQQGCPADRPVVVTTLPTELAWVTVASGVQGSAVDAMIPDDAVMTFTAALSEIVDLRITARP